MMILFVEINKLINRYGSFINRKKCNGFVVAFACCIWAKDERDSNPKSNVIAARSNINSK